MVGLGGQCAQRDRLKHETSTRSCLTLVLCRSDNGSILQSCRRKSVCGLQLDRFFGAMFWPHGTVSALVDTWWWGVKFSRVTDWTGLPVVPVFCFQWSFRSRRHPPSCHYLPPTVCRGALSLSVLRTQFGAAVCIGEATSPVAPVRNSVLTFRLTRLKPSRHLSPVSAALAA